MPSSCSCGAPLPEDARFCHRCGKPQREEDAAFQSEPEPRVAVIPAPPPATSDFHHVSLSNPLVLRTSLLVASLTTIVEIVPFINFVAPVLAGFFTVSLYQRRSGQTLSPSEGAKLAWLTAVFNAILLTIFASVSVALTGANMDAIRDQIKHQPFSPEQMQMANSPWFLVFLVLFIWMALFALSSLLHMAGGALGARFARPKTS